MGGENNQCAQLPESLENPGVDMFGEESSKLYIHPYMVSCPPRPILHIYFVSHVAINDSPLSYSNCILTLLKTCQGKAIQNAGKLFLLTNLYFCNQILWSVTLYVAIAVQLTVIINLNLNLYFIPVHLTFPPSGDPKYLTIFSLIHFMFSLIHFILTTAI